MIRFSYSVRTGFPVSFSISIPATTKLVFEYAYTAPGALVRGLRSERFTSSSGVKTFLRTASNPWTVLANISFV